LRIERYMPLPVPSPVLVPEPVLARELDIVLRSLPPYTPLASSFAPQRREQRIGRLIAKVVAERDAPHTMLVRYSVIDTGQLSGAAPGC
jgi:hypothetical protein